MNTPLCDLYTQYRTIKPDIDAAVKKFETEFATFCEARACVGVGNGTDALYLTLRALGLGSGDEVITVAHTFIATAEAISLTGARPVFVDIREDTLLLNPDALEAASTV